MVKILPGALVCAMLTTAAYAQRSTPVRLAGGKAMLSGSVTGKAYQDYLVRLGAGQSLAVRLKGRGATPYFNVNPPSSDTSLYNGSILGEKMPARQVPAAGAYIVRVYQMGAAASERKQTRFTLEVTVTGKALTPLPASADATLRGTYHAKASVACTNELQPQRKTCDAYVIRYGGGSATVEFRLGGMRRRVLIVKGKPTAHDSPEAFTYEQEGDNTILRFGDALSESYTVPEALVAGG